MNSQPTSRTLKHSLSAHLPVWLALTIVCLLTYWNSLHNGFFIDDYTLLLNNPVITHPDFLQLNPNNNIGYVYYRPVLHFLCQLSFSLFGQQAEGYQALNLSIFIAICLSLYHLVMRMFGNKTAAILSGLLMAVHPINGILVNYKITAAHGLLILAFNLSLLALLKENKPKATDYVTGGLWFIAALLCHEVAIAYPFFLAAALIISRKNTFAEAFRTTLPSVLILGAYLMIRSYYLRHDLFNGMSHFTQPVFYYSAAWIKNMFWYLSQLFYPTQIVLTFDTTITPNEVIFYHVAFLIFLFVFYRVMVFYKDRPAELLGLWWLVISFIPVTIACLSRPEIGFVIEPHWLIYGSVGFFIWLAAVLVRLRPTAKGIIWTVMIAVLISGYAGISRRYNQLWSIPPNYYHYWLTISPDNYLANFWLGHHYLKNENYARAKKYFLGAVSKGKAGYEVWENLGFVEYQMGNYEAARNYFQGVIKGYPGKTFSMDYLQRIEDKTAGR